MSATRKSSSIERFRRINSIAKHAVELPTEERPEYLDRVCEADHHLRDDVLRVLAHESGFSKEFVKQIAAEYRAVFGDDAEPDEYSLPDDDRYMLLHKLGEGGFGTVFKAYDLQMQRHVALKRLNQSTVSVLSDGRFREEIVTLAQLRHPYIARIYDSGKMQFSDGTYPFFTCELIEGQDNDLCRYATRCGFAARAKIELFLKVCEAVAYVHKHAGRAHRDLKPANILVDEVMGAPQVIDFGLAATISDIPSEPWAGTLAYMAPEQVTGSRNASVDQYALGVILFELLTGRLPRDIPLGGISEQLEYIRSADARRLRDVGNWSEDLESIVTKALSREPAKRYESVAELTDDLRRYLRDDPVDAAKPHNPVKRLRLWHKRNRSSVTVGAVVGVIVLTVGIGFAVKQARDFREADRRRALLDQQDADDKLLRGDDLVSAFEEITGRYESAKRAHALNHSWVDLEDMAVRARQLCQCEYLNQHKEIKAGSRGAYDDVRIDAWGAAAERHARELDRLGRTSARSLDSWYSVKFQEANRRTERKDFETSSKLLQEAAGLIVRINLFDKQLAILRTQQLELARAFLARMAGHEDDATVHADAAQAALDARPMSTDREWLRRQATLLVWRGRWARHDGDFTSCREFAAKAVETIEAAIVVANNAISSDEIEKAVGMLSTLRDLIEAEPDDYYGEVRPRLIDAIQATESRIPPVTP